MYVFASRKVHQFYEQKLQESYSNMLSYGLIFNTHYKYILLKSLDKQYQFRFNTFAGFNDIRLKCSLSYFCLRYALVNSGRSGNATKSVTCISNILICTANYL